MFDIIKQLTRRDKQYPERYYNLFLYQKILEGTLYDCFKFQYHQEYIGGVMNPRYVEEAERAPTITTGLNLMRSIVEESVSFLFGEDRFPRISADDEAVQTLVNNLVKDTHMVHLFQEAATKGSIGSVAIQLKVLQDRFFPVVHYSVYLTPEFDPQSPDVLTKITEKKKVLGEDLIKAGYDIDEGMEHSWFWFQRVWDDNDEVWFKPWSILEDDYKFKPTKDTKRSVQHRLGMVPWIWIKNLPGKGSSDDVDGKCSFEAAITNCIQIDYALSRADRALKYNCDPLLLLKVRSPGQFQDMVRSSNNAIVVGVEGDAKILEISGDAAHAVIETVTQLKDEALHSIHGFRANPDKLATSQSSIAQRMLYLPMVQLASQLRLSYCDSGIVPLLRMMLRIMSKMPIRVLGKMQRVTNAEEPLVLEYTDFFVPTPQDQQLEVTTIIPMVQAGLMSKATALRYLSKFFDFGDIDEELTRIKKDQDEQADLIHQQTDAEQSAIAQNQPPKPAPIGGR